MSLPEDDAVLREGRREDAVRFLLPLFFVSGATALVYQTLWSRQLHLVFGTSTFAISTVLAAFMGGLAVGGWAIGRIADQVKSPLRLYGLLEIGIGLYALVFPYLLSALAPVYQAAAASLDAGVVLFGMLQFVFVATLLLLPTALMGGTLPLLARFATLRLGSAGDRVGLLYAVNTAGAVFGTAASGFVLLPMWGLWTTTIAAAIANVALGLGAVLLHGWVRSDQAAPPVVADDLARHEPSMARDVSLVMALAGAASLIYEVAWTRVMGLMLGASVYSFSTMLLAFLIGIALGGRIGGPLADRTLTRDGIVGVLRLLAMVEVGVAVTSFALMYVYPQIPFWYVWLFDALAADQAPDLMWLMSVALSAVIMTPPAILMGIAFPVAVRAVVANENALGGPVGRLYAANTAGGVVGAFSAGFLMLPTIGVQGTIYVAATANLLAAAWLLVRGGARAGRLAPIGVAVVGIVLAFVARRPPWDPMWMTAGMYHYVSSFSDHSREGILDYAVAKYELVFYEEGLASVVTVAQNNHSGNMWLANNGKVDASTSTDMPTQVLCSLLPIQFVEDPDDVLVIGLASGITAGAVSTVPEIERLDVVELEPAIRRAAAFFEEWNNDILNDPRLNLIHNDGRNHIVLTPPETYDVIVSEPSNPWITGVSNLFTEEFFQLGKSRLKKGGVWSQWVQMYGMNTADLRSLLATFASVYPHVVMYATIDDADLVLIGSESPLVPDLAHAKRLMAWQTVKEQLAEVDIKDPMQIVSLSLMERPRLLALAGRITLNTDDNMRIEYSAPRNLHIDTQYENLALLMDYAEVPFAHLAQEPLRLAHLARTYRKRDDVGRAATAMVEAIKLLPEEDPRRQEWADEVQRWSDEMEVEAQEAEEAQ